MFDKKYRVIYIEHGEVKEETDLTRHSAHQRFNSIYAKENKFPLYILDGFHVLRTNAEACPIDRAESLFAPKHSIFYTIHDVAKLHGFYTKTFDGNVEMYDSKQIGAKLVLIKGGESRIYEYKSILHALESMKTYNMFDYFGQVAYLLKEDLTVLYSGKNNLLFGDASELFKPNRFKFNSTDDIFQHCREIEVEMNTPSSQD